MIAIGSSDVSVMPGATLASEDLRLAVGVDDQSIRDRSPRPSARCASSATCGQPVGDSRVEPGRRVPRGDAGGVAGGVVVHTVAGHDLDGR